MFPGVGPSNPGHGTSYQSGAKSTGAWMSHSSVSGPVNASKEKRLCSEAGGVAVKLGGQENRAAPAEGEMVICASPVLQGACQSIGLNFLSAPILSPRLSCLFPRGTPISATPTLVLPTSIPLTPTLKYPLSECLPVPTIPRGIHSPLRQILLVRQGAAAEKRHFWVPQV